MSFVNASMEKYSTPQKVGDLVNLVITIIPYGIKLIKLTTGLSTKEFFQRLRNLKEIPYKNLPPKEFVKKLFSLKMVAYLGSMFLTQKFLWKYGSPMVENYFSSSEFSIQSVTGWILFGGLVGITSLATGTFISAKIKNFFNRQIKNLWYF